MLSTKIKELRKKSNLTQLQLAEILGIDQTAISKWEHEQALPDTKMLISLSKYFDVSIDYLVGNSTYYYPDRLPSTSSPAPELSADEWEIIECYRKFSPHFKDLAQTTMKTWASAYDGTPNAGSRTTNKRA